MGFSLGLLIESAVAVLMALTIGYCVVLNRRLVSLHADREAMRQIVGNLVTTTNLANKAITELKATASEADQTLSARLAEAERFGVELASHVTAGNALMQRIAKVTGAAQHSKVLSVVPDKEPEKQEAPRPTTGKARAALEHLSAHAGKRGEAA